MLPYASLERIESPLEPLPAGDVFSCGVMLHEAMQAAPPPKDARIKQWQWEAWHAEGKNTFAGPLGEPE